MTITVQETVLLAASLLGIQEDVREHLAGGASAAGERDCALLLSSFQQVENELALDYLPLIAEDEIVTASGVVAYSDLEKPAVRVLCVEDEWGKSIKYELFPTYIKTATGKVRIVYSYSPTGKTLEGNSEYQTLASARLFAYGMAASYSLAVGELTAASAWEKKYKEAIRAAYRQRQCKRLRSRRWV